MLDDYSIQHKRVNTQPPPSTPFQYEVIFQHMDNEPATEPDDRYCRTLDMVEYIFTFVFDIRQQEKRKGILRERLVSARLAAMLYLLIGSRLDTVKYNDFIDLIKCNKISYELFVYHLNQAKKYISQHPIQNQ